MSGLSRRELLKRSAVVAGAAWASPVLFTGDAWAHVSNDHGSGGAAACACGDGITVYAKFAPGNAQTCVNQCLQPGQNVIRLEFDCLVANGVIGVCDEVASNDDYASLNFYKGTRPLRVAIKSENDCYIARCNEGFNKIYHWSTSYNCEDYPEAPCPTNVPAGYDTSHDFTDPNSDPAKGMFRVYTGGNSTPGPCTGNVDANGLLQPSGTHAGGSATGDHPFYGLITGMALSTMFMSTSNTKLNFIEFELCIPNASKLPCPRTLCNN